MTNEHDIARRCQLVGRLLQVQPSDEALAAFRALFADEEAPDASLVEQDYLRLFVGLGTPLAPPWESTWANDARLLFQRQTLDVRYWYRSAGLQVAALHSEPDDHIGYELEFAGLLLERGEADTAAAFVREHPLAWAARWKDAVEEAASCSFYKRLAQEALALLERIAAIAA